MDIIFLGIIQQMEEVELKGYQGLNKEGAFFVKSPIYGLVVASSKLPNRSVTIPFRILVTILGYLNHQNYTVEHYKEPKFGTDKLNIITKIGILQIHQTL